MKPQEISFEPTYKKENGLWYLDVVDVPLPSDFKSVEESIVSIPPQQLGGNHKHPRREAFVAVTEGLELVWLDGNGITQRRKMYSANSKTLFIIPPFLSHAVVNSSSTSSGILFEFADAQQSNVEEIMVV